MLSLYIEQKQGNTKGTGTGQSNKCNFQLITGFSLLIIYSTLVRVTINQDGVKPILYRRAKNNESASAVDCFGSYTGVVYYRLQ